jgi:hypothetical protein
MSTTGFSSWAVDLKDVGAIYPFQGWEVVMVILGLIFWIGWHIMQMRMEGESIEEEVAADPRGEEAKRAIDRY